MPPSDNSARPSRREPVPLPECLTRLLNSHSLDAGYIAQPAGCAVGSPQNRTYAQALASIWFDLDRLDELIGLMMSAKKPQKGQPRGAELRQPRPIWKMGASASPLG